MHIGKWRKIISGIFAIVIVLSMVQTLSVVAASDTENTENTANQQETKQTYTVEACNNSEFMIAVESGTSPETSMRKLLPNASYMYVKSFSDGVLAVTSGKANGYASDNYALMAALRSGTTGIQESGIGEKSVAEVCVGISRKTQVPDLTKLLNKFLAEIEKDGTLEDMQERWVIAGDYTMPEIDKPSQPKGTIYMGTTGLCAPYTFYEGDELSGMDMELIRRFSLWSGYEVEVSTYDWDGLLAALTSGKVDCAMSCLYKTPEREEVMDFSDPYLVLDSVLIVPDNSESAGFWSDLKSSFVKTFITEDRWKILAQGLLVTLEISVLALIFGSILGFLIALSCRSGFKPLTMLVHGFMKFMEGVPIVVVLMILFYLIFSGKDVNGQMIAVLGFTLTFGTAVASMLVNGIENMDPGQWEGAKALGFGKTDTFLRIIFPQVVLQILPLYKGEFVSMMKLTSVVGYISVVDLTKAGDIIRSRTYEAFFPLIVTAVLYFLLAWLITGTMTKLEGRVLPGKKKPKDYSRYLLPEASEQTEKTAASSLDGNAVVISAKDLRKEYKQVTPLEHVDLEVKKGEVIGVIGPSGTGKSTLIRCISHLELPSSGDVTILDYHLSAEPGKRQEAWMHMGMVFQGFNLFPHLTVIENIMLAPMRLKNMDRAMAYTRGIKLLEQLGIRDKENCFPDQLSGGQKQRAAIARTLAMDPDIIFCDEPTSALDPRMTREVTAALKVLRNMGITLMIVTHEMHLVRDLATRVLFMDEGGIYEQGTPDQIFENPTREKTREFVNQTVGTKEIITPEDPNQIEIRLNLMEFAEELDLSRRLTLDMLRLINSVGNSLLQSLHKEVEVLVTYNEKTEILSLEFVYEKHDWVLTDEDKKYIEELMRNRGSVRLVKEEKTDRLVIYLA